MLMVYRPALAIRCDQTKVEFIREAADHHKDVAAGLFSEVLEKHGLIPTSVLLLIHRDQV